MSGLTAPQIAERLKREDLPAAHYQETMRAITARRAHLRARLESIETRNGAGLRAAITSGDSEQIAALSRESEAIDDEIGVLSYAETRACQLNARAVEREAVENGRRAHKRITKALAAVETALTAYAIARQELDDVVSAIAGHNDIEHGRSVALGDNAKVSRLTVDGPTFERVCAAMHPPLLVREEQRLGARSGLRRQLLGPEPPYYAEPPTDYRELRIAHESNIFQRRDS